MKKILLLMLAVCLLSTAAMARKTRVVITTNYGKIVMELYDGTPQHRDNMIKLVRERFLDSTLFHRVIPAFMIQGGDPDSKQAQAGQRLGNGGTGYLVPAEIRDEYFHRRGAVGMARDNNPEKASSGSQFYIVVGRTFTDSVMNLMESRSGRKIPEHQRAVYRTEGGTPHLDGNYTVFGIITEGMDVVDKIVNLQRDASDRPLTDARMLKVRFKKRFLFF